MAETQTATTKATIPPERTERKPLYKLKQNRMHLGESRIRWWFAEIEDGTPYEELFNPVFWDVHGYKFAPGDFILAKPDEGHYTAQLEVIGIGAGGVKIEEFYRKDRLLVDAPASLVGQYRVKYAGPHHKWRVERIADNHVEQAGFASEVEANKWLADNMKALSRAKAA